MLYHLLTAYYILVVLLCKYYFVCKYKRIWRWFDFRDIRFHFFLKTVSTNVGKKFLQLLDHRFPTSNKPHKIFNTNTLNLSYCCTPNVASIIKSHNKKLINTSIRLKNTLSCKCRKKHECPLDGKCRAENIVYKCIASVHGYPNKVYLGTAEGDFKQRFCNHRMSFYN